jgi:Zn-dependent protease with chaperone function
MKEHWFERFLPKSWKIPVQLCVELDRQHGTKRCGKCPVGGICFVQPQRPVPLAAWLFFGVALAVPMYASLHPQSALKRLEMLQCSEPTLENCKENDDDENDDVKQKYKSPSERAVEANALRRRERYERIFAQVGLEYPERVRVIESDATESPTAIGTNTRAGAVVLMPRMLAALTNPATELYIPYEDDESRTVFHGTVGELDDETRAEILRETGVLLPTPEQIDSIIGHEATHLFYNHSLKSGVVGGLSALAAHVAIKMYARWAWARNPVSATLAMEGVNPTISVARHCALVIVAVAAGTIALSWYQERQADMHSALSLRLEHSALSLAKAKQAQNRREHRLGNRKFTASGIDLTEIEHPPVNVQIQYLSELIDGDDDEQPKSD